MGVIRLKDVDSTKILRIERISDLARALGVSERSLREEFKQHERVTLSQARTKQRITRVKQLLVRSNLSCKEIILSVGYSRAEVGARAFKRFVGTTMGKFRRNHVP